MSENGAFNDQELQTAFASCTLCHEAWNHRTHVRMAFLYASHHPLPLALDRMRTFIKAFNASKQVPEALERGYHETMTVAFMRLVYDCVLRNGPFPNSAAFCERNPELLDKTVLRQFYSRERLVNLEAKKGFVEPDLRGLPGDSASVL